jgi:hypothetical protein
MDAALRGEPDQTACPLLVRHDSCDEHRVVELRDELLEARLG